MALEATTRLWRDVARTELLGTAVKVTDQQYPRVWEAAKKAGGRAATCACPSIFAAPSSAIKVKVLGTDDSPHLIVNLELAEKLDDTELRRRDRARARAHPERPHPVRDRAALPEHSARVLRALGRAARDHDAAGVVAPRRGHVRSRVAARGARSRQDAAAMVKLELGLDKGSAFNADEYLRALPDVKKGIGRYAELFRSHPVRAQARPGAAAVRRLRAVRAAHRPGPHRQAQPPRRRQASRRPDQRVR